MKIVRTIGYIGAVLVTILSCNIALAATNTAVSPDGRYEVYIQQIGAGDEDGNGSQSLVLMDKRTQSKRTMLVSHYDDDHTRNLTGLNTPIFSLDGGYLDVNSTDPSPYRCAVQQINLRTGEIRFVTAGCALSLIRTGQYRGFLLVQMHVMYDRPEGGTYNPVFVMRPDGHKELTVPGSADDDGELAVGPWLAHMGWHAW